MLDFLEVKRGVSRFIKFNKSFDMIRIVFRNKEGNIQGIIETSADFSNFYRKNGQMRSGFSNVLYDYCLNKNVKSFDIKGI